jgi:hypothetical protein
VPGEGFVSVNPEAPLRGEGADRSDVAEVSAAPRQRSAWNRACTRTRINLRLWLNSFSFYLPFIYQTCYNLEVGGKPLKHRAPGKSPWRPIFSHPHQEMQHADYR